MDRNGWNWLVLLMLALLVLAGVVAIIAHGPLKKWAASFG
jgi:hypothetical protein